MSAGDYSHADGEASEAGVGEQPVPTPDELPEAVGDDHTGAQARGKGKSRRPLRPIQYTEIGYVSKAMQYANDVVSGKIPACIFVRQACQRQLDDLHRAAMGDVSFPYHFDPKKAEDVCFFVEQLVHTKGAKGGKPFIMEPWQYFSTTTVFGWLRNDNDKRRFRKFYGEIPKGNGKSPWTAGIGLYMLCADGEMGAEIYAAATQREQAKYVFEPAQFMARKCTKLAERFGVVVGAHSILVPHTASSFKTFSSDSDSVEGANPHFSSVDELHAHPSREFFDNLETAHGKREQDLMWIITTAGNDITGICYEVRSIVVDILAGKKKDESIFGIIYTIDKKDDWAEDANWVKANPNWGVSVQPTTIGQKGNLAKQMVSKQASFKTKHLNVWVNSAHSWMDMRKWAMCKDSTMSIEDFANKAPVNDPNCKLCTPHKKCADHGFIQGSEAIIGMDLASRIDLIAVMKLFWKDVEEKEGTFRHYYLFGHYQLPESTVEKSENSQYLGWGEAHNIVVTPGEVNDFDAVEAHLKEMATRFNISEIAHDPYLADMLVAHLQNEGLPTMVAVKQSTENFSPALKELEALVLSGRLHHDGDPVLEWAVQNVEVKPDHNDNIYPRKAKGQQKNKIDPVVALLMALKRAQAQTDQPFSWIG